MCALVRKRLTTREAKPQAQEKPPAAEKETRPPPRKKESPSSGQLPLVMGFDFGTAFSKVVVRAPDLPESPAWAVAFDDLADASSPFLLPTLLFVGRDGSFALTGNDDCRLRGIKYNLMKNAAAAKVNGHDVHCVNACAAYLALAIRRAKESFMRRHGHNFAGETPEWEAVNVGIPAATKNDNPTKRAFQRAANAAWVLAGNNDDITIDSVAKEINRADGAKEPPLLVPEVAAQIQGYRRSDVRRSGLHIMADAGASTLDVCSFLIRDDFKNAKGGDVAVYCAKVRELGAEILEQQKRSIARGGEVSEIEAAFWHECQKALREVVWETKHRKASKEINWKKNRMGPGEVPKPLPFLLCGGASAVSGYKRLSEHAAPGLLTGGEKFDDVMMPKPGNLLPKELPESIYHRLSVAYGLSMRSFDDVVLPSDIPDAPNDDMPTNNYRDRFPGKETM